MKFKYLFVIHNFHVTICSNFEILMTEANAYIGFCKVLSLLNTVTKEKKMKNFCKTYLHGVIT